MRMPPELRRSPSAPASFTMMRSLSILIGSLSPLVLTADSLSVIPDDRTAWPPTRLHRDLPHPIPSTPPPPHAGEGCSAGPQLPHPIPTTPPPPHAGEGCSAGP